MANQTLFLFFDHFSLNLFLNYNRHIPKKSKIVVFLVIEVMNTKALKKNVSKSEKMLPNTTLDSSEGLQSVSLTFERSSVSLEC